MATLIESLRKISVERVFTVNAFSNSWNTHWKTLINQQLSTPLTASKILDLGDHLSDVFLSTRAAAARSSANSQGGVSSAGAAWESLVCWYLNLCTIGTRTVAFKLRSMIPSSFKDALTINYGTTITNSESDLIVVVFPNDPDFTTDLNSRVYHNHEGDEIKLFIKTRLVPNRVLGLFDSLSAHQFNNFSLGVVQCKTNWNDIAQIPMLWDLVYSARSFIAGSQISLGKNNFQLSNLTRFTYSFVTVPTNSLNNYTPEKMQVKRVANLSGKNYWGFPTKNGVAFSVKEIFNKNFSNGFGNLRNDLNSQIPHINTNYAYFDL
jgi:hypothetical protein